MEDIKVRVCIFAFDCLYLNSETLLQKPLTDRRAALQSAVDEKPGELQFATAKVSGTVTLALALVTPVTWRAISPDHS